MYFGLNIEYSMNLKSKSYDNIDYKFDSTGEGF